MAWIIYKHTLVADCEHKGWSYIGQTCQEDLNKRWRDGKGYLTEDTLFSRAIKKYGIDNWNTIWKHEILEADIQTKELANEREKYWIAYYHTYINDNEPKGYNLTIGGEGSIGYKHSDETKDKIKQRLHEIFPNGRESPMKNKHHSEKTKEKLRQDNLKNPRKYWLGKHRSKETVEKIKEKRTLQIILPESYKKANETKIKNNSLGNKHIYQIDLTTNCIIKEWESLLDAAESLNLKAGNICNVCRGKRKSTGRFGWKYVEEK